MKKLIAKKFYFMRHGETRDNRTRTIGGITDTPLTTKGQSQAQLAGKNLQGIKFSHVAVSPLQRALSTAQLALPGEDLEVYTGLTERDWGDLEGRPTLELTDRFSCPAGGEPWQEFCDRVLRTVNKLLTLHDDLLIVAHSGTYRALCAAIGMDPNAQQIANASIWAFLPTSSEEGEGWAVQPLEC